MSVCVCSISIGQLQLDCNRLHSVGCDEAEIAGARFTATWPIANYECCETKIKLIVSILRLENTVLLGLLSATCDLNFICFRFRRLSNRVVVCCVSVCGSRKPTPSIYQCSTCVQLKSIYEPINRTSIFSVAQIFRRIFLVTPSSRDNLPKKFLAGKLRLRENIFRKKKQDSLFLSLFRSFSCLPIWSSIHVRGGAEFLILSVALYVPINCIILFKSVRSSSRNLRPIFLGEGTQNISYQQVVTDRNAKVMFHQLLDIHFLMHFVVAMLLVHKPCKTNCPMATKTTTRWCTLALWPHAAECCSCYCCSEICWSHWTHTKRMVCDAAIQSGVCTVR